MRIADPAVNSPVIASFAPGRGLRRVRQAARRAAQGAIRPSRALPRRRAVRARPAASRACVARGERELEIVLRRALPADPLLVRDAVHDAGAVGGGRLLRRPGGPRRSSPIIRSAPARSGSRATTSRAASCSSAIANWYGAAAPRMATRRAPSSPAAIGEPRTSRKGASTPRTRAGRCRSSIASSSAASRRTSRASTSSCRATTTSPASSRRASTRWSRATASRREMAARGMRLDKDGRARRSSTSASTWTTRSSARRRASAAASCARR